MEIPINSQIANYGTKRRGKHRAGLPQYIILVGLYDGQESSYYI